MSSIDELKPAFELWIFLGGPPAAITILAFIKFPLYFKKSVLFQGWIIGYISVFLWVVLFFLIYGYQYTGTTPTYQSIENLLSFAAIFGFFGALPGALVHSIFGK